MIRALAFALAGAALAVAPPAQADPPDPVFVRGLPAAMVEGACVPGIYRCVWEAKERGNGKGRSLLITRYRRGWVAIPISHRRADRLTDAYCDRPNVTCDGYTDYR